MSHWDRQYARTRRIIDALIPMVASRERVWISKLLSPCREKDVVEARWAVMYAARQARCSYPSIARALYLKDHTTVIHGVERARELMIADLAYAALVNDLVAVSTRSS